MTEEPLSPGRPGWEAQPPDSCLTTLPGPGHWYPAPAIPGPVDQPHPLPFPMATGHCESPPPFTQLLGLPLESSLNPSFLSHPRHQLSILPALPSTCTQDPTTGPPRPGPPPSLSWTTSLTSRPPWHPQGSSECINQITPLSRLKPPVVPTQSKVQSPRHDPRGPLWAGQRLQSPFTWATLPSAAPSTRPVQPIIRA